MKKQIFLLFAIHLLCAYLNPIQAKNYLVDRIPQGDKREATFRLCFDLLSQRNAHILVETGTARNGCANCIGDGCSTILFADWAKDHGAELFSVDIDSSAIFQSKLATEAVNPHVQFAVQDSISFLKDFDCQIDFLYLDSYDFVIDDPTPSQLHHLYEIQAAYPHLHKKTVVMIDDCDLPHGGKGKLAIQFLQSRGWEVLMSGYQTVLIFPDNLPFTQTY